MNCRILTDDRWAPAHGISRYGNELLGRLGAAFDVTRIGQTYSIRDPLAPWKLSAAIRGQTADVFWSPGFVPPSFSPIPFVFTIHDLTHLHRRRKLHTAYFNRVIKPLCRRAYRIATVSEYSRAEICAWANVSPEQVAVIPNGVSRCYSPDGARYEPGFPYLLYVGNHLPHKNLKRALTAFAAAKLAQDVRFLLTGSPDSELVELATRLGIQERVVFAGAVPESDLPACYRGALAVTLLSTNEGFGLPVLESMASGIPVIASNATSIPEIAGGAALLVDPLNVDEIASGMQQIVCDSDLRAACRQSGLMQSRRFDWERPADRLRCILSDAAASRSAH